MFDLNEARLDIFDIDDFVVNIEKQAAELIAKFHEKLEHVKQTSSQIKCFLTELGIIAHTNNTVTNTTVIGFAECHIDNERLGQIKDIITCVEYLRKPNSISKLLVSENTEFTNHIIITTDTPLYNGLETKNHQGTILILIDSLGNIVKSKTFMKVKKTYETVYFKSKRVLTITFKGSNFDYDGMRALHKDLYMDYCVENKLHEFGNQYEDLNPAQNHFNSPILTYATQYLPLAIGSSDTNVEFTNDFVSSLNNQITQKLNIIEDHLGNRNSDLLSRNSENPISIPIDESIILNKTVQRFLDMKPHKFNIETDVLFNDMQLTKLMSSLASNSGKSIISYGTLRRLSRIINKNKYITEQSRNNYLENLTHTQKSFFVKVNHINTKYNLNLKYHQLFAIMNVLPMNVSILKKDVGLGKTRAAICAILARGGKHNLIVTEPGNVLELYREFKEQLNMADICKIIKSEKDIKCLNTFNLIGYNTLGKVIKESSLTEMTLPPSMITIRIPAHNIQSNMNIITGLIENNKFASCSSFSLNIHDAVKDFVVHANELKGVIQERITDDFTRNLSKPPQNIAEPIKKFYKYFTELKYVEMKHIVANTIDSLTTNFKTPTISIRSQPYYLSTFLASNTTLSGARANLNVHIAANIVIVRLMLYIITAKAHCASMYLPAIMNTYKYSTNKKYEKLILEIDTYLSTKENIDWITINEDETIEGSSFFTLTNEPNILSHARIILTKNFMECIGTILAMMYKYKLEAYLTDIYNSREEILNNIATREEKLQQVTLNSFSSKAGKIVKTIGDQHFLSIPVYDIHNILLDITYAITEYSDEVENIKLKAKYRTKTLAGLLSGKLNTVVYDECQSLKNITSAKYIAATQLKAKNYLFMSATPVGNHMSELLSYLTIGYGPRSLHHMTDMEYRNFTSYRKPSRRNKKSYTAIVKPSGIEYELDITNTRSDFEKKAFPLERLNMLVERNVTRVLRSDSTIVKDEAFKFDLKEYKMYATPSPEHMMLYATQMEIVYQANMSGKYEDSREALSCLMNLVKISEIPHLISPDFENQITNKQNLIVELAKKQLNDNRSVIIFTQFQEMVKIIANELSKRVSNNVYMLGDTLNAEQRFKLIDGFRKQEGNACIVGTVNNLGKGFNLACADVVIMSDLPWSPLLYAQSIGRILRPDQQGNPEVFMIMNKYMIDMYKFDTIMAKLNMIKKYLDRDSSISEDQTTKIDYRAFILNLLDRAMTDGVLDSNQFSEPTTLSNGV